MRLAVLGVGLVGGSIGLAARSRAGARVCGYDPDPHALAAALELGAIDERAEDLPSAVKGADVVFVAAPVGALPDIVREALGCAGPGCVVSDVGSTKRAIAGAIDDERFVAGHPLAGGEQAGVEHARADLFDGAVWYLTPGPATAVASVERVSGLITRLGATAITADAATHDRLMACVSHLPHVFANVLVDELAGALFTAPDDDPARAYGLGSSFRDATRVAGANPAIWTDIYMANRDALVDVLDEAIDRLQHVRGMLKEADAPALDEWGRRAGAQREALLASALASGV